MGNEGQESPRDVAGEEQKHPWEVFPADEASAIEQSEKQRAKQQEKQAKQEKRQAKKSSVKLWIKAHTSLTVIIIIVAVLLLGGGGTFVGIKISEANNKKDDETASTGGITEGEDGLLYYDDGTIFDPTYGYPEGFKITDALTSAQAFDFANTVVREIVLEGEDPIHPNPLKVEDNMNSYIKNLDTEYEKQYFEIFKYYMISNCGDPDRGKYLLEIFDEKHMKLDARMRYAYLKAWAEYYDQVGDKENRNKYHELINTDPEFIEEFYVFYDADTGEKIDDDELTENLKEGMGYYDE